MNRMNKKINSKKVSINIKHLRRRDIKIESIKKYDSLKDFIPGKKCFKVLRK